MTQARAVLEELQRRQEAGDPSALDLVAPDLVQHAAGPQGREGWAATLATVSHDLGDPTTEVHAVVAEGDTVVVHVTLHGTHRASTMPLLAGIPPTGRRVHWTFMHRFRVADGLVAEHWACRDDVGLLAQLGAWPPTAG